MKFTNEKRNKIMLKKLNKKLDSISNILNLTGIVIAIIALVISIQVFHISNEKADFFDVSSIG